MADHGHSHTVPPHTPPTAGPRKLVRRPDDGHIAGVCSGVAEYFHVDPIIVRIAAVVLLFTGPGFFVYLAAWIFVPAADGSMLVDNVPPIPEDKTTQIVGIALIVLAVSVMFGGWWSPAREWLWPAGLIAVGAWLLLRRKDDPPVEPTPPPPPPGTTPPWAVPNPTSVAPAPPTPAGATDAPADPADPADPSRSTDSAAVPSDSADPTAVPSAVPADPTESTHGGVAGPHPDDGDADAPSTPPTGDTLVDDSPATVFATETGAGGGPPWGPDPTMAAPFGSPAPPSSRRRRRFVGPLVFGALLIWGGIAWLAGVRPEDTLAVGLCIIGVGFVVGAFVGGARMLFLPAFFVGAALLVTSVVDIPWGGGIGEIRWDVDQVSELDRRYERAVGDATLDLRDLLIRAGTRVEIEANLGVGEMTIYLPDDVSAEVTADVGAGEARVLGRTDEGISIDIDRTVRGSADRGTLELDIHVGLGELRVIQST